MKNKTIHILKKELKTILKDKKTLTIMLMTPLIIPFIIIFYGFFSESIQGEDKTYSVGINYELTDTEIEMFDEIGLEAVNYSSKEELEKGYENGEYAVYIIKEDNKYNLYVNSASTSGSMTLQMTQAYLDSYNDYLGKLYLVGEDIDTSKVYENVKIEVNNLDENDYMATLIYSVATSYIILIIIQTAATIATDSISGEKERGTLETLLTFPVKTSNIISGKYLAILFACVLNLILSLIFTFASIWIDQKIFNFSFASISFGSVVITCLVCFLCSIIVSGLCIGFTAKCKSFKESQQSLSYLTMLSMVPMFMELFEIKTSYLIAAIPVIGNEMILNDIITGKLNYMNLGIMLISNILISLIIIKIVANIYKSEKVLFS